jgi:aryl carrier-like protein
MIRLPKAKSGSIATLGVDIGKNTFHLVGLDKRGAIVLRERLSRAQIEVRFANLAPCLSAWRLASARWSSEATGASAALARAHTWVGP